MLGGGGGVSHPLQLTTGLVIKSITTSPTLAGEHMLFILQVSILSEQMFDIIHNAIIVDTAVTAESDSLLYRMWSHHFQTEQY